MNDLYDAAIVGASVSGASLASLLGKEGLRVALIDREHFPRRKACGEGISDIALEALRRMGLEADLASTAGKPFYSYRIDLGTRSFAFSSRKGRPLRGVGMQRYLLDSALATHASRLPTVRSFFGSPVTQIESRIGHGMIHLANGERLRARQVILADGANSQSAARLGIPKTSTGRPLWGMSFILEGSFSQSAGEVVVLLRDGFEVNCTPVSETRLNVAFLAEKGQVKRLQDSKLQEQLLLEAAEKSYFKGIPMGEPLQVGPVGCTRRPYTYGDVMLLGDVTESLDPIAGMGMTHGILMAELAGQALIAQLRDGVPREETFREYTRAAEKMTRPYRGITHLTASLFRSPLRRLLIPPLSFAHLPDFVRGALKYHPLGEKVSPAFPLILLHLIGS